MPQTLEIFNACCAYRSIDTSARGGTYCVFGAPRGGTSMVAGVLRMLGVFMGEDIDPATNEDRAFLSHGGDVQTFAMAERRGAYLRDARRVIEDRNSKHRYWGWKDPIGTLYFGDVVGNLHQPVAVIVLRDMLSVSFGEHRKNGTPLLESLVQAHRLYGMVLELLKDSSLPAILISYEKAILKPRACVEALSDLMGLSIPPREKNDIIRFIQPERNHAELPGSEEDASDEKSETSWAIRLSRRNAQPGDYAARYETERRKVETVTARVAAGAYKEAVKELDDLALLYHDAFGIRSLSEHQVVEGLFPTTESAYCIDHPALLTDFYYLKGMCRLNYRKSYGSALRSFQTAYHLALAALQEKRDFVMRASAIKYLWDARFHEAFTEKILGNALNAEAIAIQLRAVESLPSDHPLFEAAWPDGLKARIKEEF